jgi:hypothetical protein
MDYAAKSFEPEIFKNLDEYVDLRVTQNFYWWDKDSKGNPIIQRNKVRSELVPCKPPRML